MDEARLNKGWPAAQGETLLQMQGEARAVRRLLRVIEQGPVIKDTTGG